MVFLHCFSCCSCCCCCCLTPNIFLYFQKCIVGQYPLRLCGHLCGDRAVQVLNGDSTFVKHLIACGFQRVQVNATSINGVDTSAAALMAQVPMLRQVMLETPELEWIVQKNDETTPLLQGLIFSSSPNSSNSSSSETNVVSPSNLSVLNDASMGLGVLIAHFDPPPSVVEVPKGCGYAGGIGPLNIVEVLESIKQVANGRAVWVDMESSLRRVDSNGVDVFDVDKCLDCCRQTVELCCTSVQVPGTGR